jgi:hypothetical protein
MDALHASLDRMKESSVIMDDKYWDIKLADGETPVAAECKDKTIYLQAGEFFIQMERKGYYGDRCFYAHVILPEGFHHEDLNLDWRHETWDTSTLEFCRLRRRYTWRYRSYFFVDLFRPLVEQHLCQEHKIVGPVQVLDDLRSVLRVLMRRRHTDPTDTFRKNLQWMRRRCAAAAAAAAALNTDWDVKLEEGDVMMAPEHISDRSIRLRTVDGFTVNIGVYSYSCDSLVGHVEAPRNSLHLTSCQDARWIRMTAVCGAAQMLEEARTIIKDVMRENAELARTKKCEMIKILREELMMKVCHPRRVAAWTAAGFDPFE